MVANFTFNTHRMIKGVGGLGNTHTARVLKNLLGLIRESGDKADTSPYVRPHPSAYWGHHNYSRYRRRMEIVPLHIADNVA